MTADQIERLSRRQAGRSLSRGEIITEGTKNQQEQEMTHRDSEQQRFLTQELGDQCGDDSMEAGGLTLASRLEVGDSGHAPDESKTYNRKVERKKEGQLLRSQSAPFPENDKIPGPLNTYLTISKTPGYEF